MTGDDYLKALAIVDCFAANGRMSNKTVLELLKSIRRGLVKCEIYDVADSLNFAIKRMEQISEVSE